MLSKIENGQFTDNTQVEVTKLLRQYLEDYKEVYQYREIITSVEAVSYTHLMELTGLLQIAPFQGMKEEELVALLFGLPNSCLLYTSRCV